MEEIWKPIGEAPDYMVSNLGRVKSFRSKSYGIILKQSYYKDGYKRVTLYDKYGGKFYRRVHRLVAEAFIENPDPKRFKLINHLDSNRENNIVTNLEWCNNSRNQLHSFREGGRVWNRKAHEKDFESIKSINVITKEENIFDSINACARYYGVSDCAIHNRLSGRAKNPSSSPKSSLNGIYFEKYNCNDHPEKELLQGENPCCEARDIS